MKKIKTPPKTDKTPPKTDFDKCINGRIEKTKQLLLVKGEEYIRNNDRFHNFNVAARINNETPTRALHGMMTKHLVSYLDILNDIDAGKKVDLSVIDEKIGDLIVYLHLQEALIKNYHSFPF